MVLFEEKFWLDISVGFVFTQNEPTNRFFECTLSRTDIVRILPTRMVENCTGNTT